MTQRSWTILALALYWVFVVYGSLIPFELRLFSFEEALDQFKNIRYLDLGVVSRADWIANILLYIPLSMLSCLVVMQGHHRARLTFGAVIFALFVSIPTAFLVEFFQTFFAPRTVSINDLIAESIGSVIGVLIWFFFRRKLMHLWASFQRGGVTSIKAVLSIYALLYLAQSFFPFDFVVSLDELRWKIDQGSFAWAISLTCGSPLRCGVGWLAEFLAIMPLSIFAVLAGNRMSKQRAFLMGCLLGLVIEVFQFFMVSGAVEGASILLRGTGMLAGCYFATMITRHGLSQIAHDLNKFMPFIVVAYIAALTTLAGWYSNSWHGLGAAMAELSEVSWLPFYYHYFTTELQAVISLLSNVAMYLPIGCLIWARNQSQLKHGHSRAWMVAIMIAMVVAFVIEFGKLFVDGKHPDMTNVLIAVCAAYGAFVALNWFTNVLNQQSASSGLIEVETAHRVDLKVLSASQLARYAMAATLGLMLLVGLIHHPYVAVLVILLGLYGWMLSKRPLLWLLMIPALLPSLDLSEFTGRLVLDEFDLFVITTLMVAAIRWKGCEPRNNSSIYMACMVMLGLSWLISTWIGLKTWLGAETGFHSGSYSVLDVWYVDKGLLWALLLVPIINRIQPKEIDAAKKNLVIGVCVGLLVLVMSVIWERAVYVDLFDFDNVFRVTGTFASMNTGGAYIEAFIALALPMLLVAILRAENLLVKAVGALLVIATLYAMFVTYSRAGYAAIVVSGSILLVGWLLQGQRFKKSMLVAAISIAVGLSLVPILSGSFAEKRLEQSVSDWNVRLDHWSRALSLMDGSMMTQLFGMGFGQYPLNYLLYADAPTKPGRYQIKSDGQNTGLILIAGEPIYLEQVVSIDPGAQYNLSIEFKAIEPGSSIKVHLCEKALLYSFKCISKTIQATQAQSGWTARQFVFETDEFESKSIHGRFKLSMQPVSGSIDVKRISLKDSTGVEILRNREFGQGDKYWFMTADKDLAWHIHQQWLEIYFMMGLVGIAGFIVMLFIAVKSLVLRILKADLYAVTLLSSLSGFLTVGMLSSVVDNSRMLFLLVLIGCVSILAENNDRREFDA